MWWRQKPCAQTKLFWNNGRECVPKEACTPPLHETQIGIVGALNFLWNFMISQRTGRLLALWLTIGVDDKHENFSLLCSQLTRHITFFSIFCCSVKFYISAHLLNFLHTLKTLGLYKVDIKVPKLSHHHDHHHHFFFIFLQFYFERRRLLGHVTGWLVGRWSGRCPAIVHCRPLLPASAR